MRLRGVSIGAVGRWKVSAPIKECFAGGRGPGFSGSRTMGLRLVEMWKDSGGRLQAEGRRTRRVEAARTARKGRSRERGVRSARHRMAMVSAWRRARDLGTSFPPTIDSRPMVKTTVATASGRQFAEPWQGHGGQERLQARSAPSPMAEAMVPPG